MAKRRPKKTYGGKKGGKTKSRAGKHFYKGDDLTKVKHDRKLRGRKYEEWEK